MKEEKYTFTRQCASFYYEFQSVGPRGVIRKVVNFLLVEEEPQKIFNLGFGDWDEFSNNINDSIATSNQDRQKVLMTVAATVLDFTEEQRDAWIFIRGSTDSRTRLYQMGIGSFWNEIENQFIVLGFKDGKWMSFVAGVNFESFLIRRK